MKSALLLAILLLAQPIAAQPSIIEASSIMRLAESEHPRLQAAKGEKAAIDATAPTLWGIENPTLMYYMEGVDLPQAVDERFQFNIMAENPFRIGGKREALSRRQQIAELRIVNIQREIRREVKLALAQYWFDTSMERVADSLVRLSSAIEETTKALFEAGERGKIDYLRSQIAKKNAENVLLQRATSRRQSLLNVWKSAALPPKDSIALDSIRIHNEPRWLEMALPDRIAKTEIEAAASDIRVQQESFLPDIGIGYYYHNIITPLPSYHGFEVSLQLPLLFSFNQSPRIEEAKYREAVRRSEAAEIALTVNFEKERIVREIDIAKAQVDNFQQFLLPQVKELLELSNESFSAGESSFLELLQSYNETVVVFQDYYQTLYRLYTALVEAEYYSEEELLVFE